MFGSLESTLLSNLLVDGSSFKLKTLSILCVENCCREEICLSKKFLSLSFKCSFFNVSFSKSSSDMSFPLSDVSLITSVCERSFE